MRLTKYSITFLLLINVTVSYSQGNYEENQLVNLTITNNQFKAIVDSFLNNESQCPYYNKLITCINMYARTSFTFIRLEALSAKDSGVALGLHPKGYTYLNNHLLFFYGDTCSSIFSAEKKMEKFTYFEPNDSLRANSPRHTDDSNPYWVYHYYSWKNQFKPAIKYDCNGNISNYPLKDKW